MELQGNYDNAERIERFCRNIFGVLDNLSFADKKSMLREVIDRIEIKDENVSVFGIIRVPVEEVPNEQNMLAVSQPCC